MKNPPKTVSEITPDSIPTLTEPFKDACYLFDNLKYLQNSGTEADRTLATSILDKYNALTTSPTDSPTPPTPPTPVQVMAFLSNHEAIRPALKNAAKKYRRNIIQDQNQGAVVAFNPYDAATQNATNYADPMFEALKQYMETKGGVE